MIFPDIHHPFEAHCGSSYHYADVTPVRFCLGDDLLSNARF
jgi:hypothetical protein